MQRQQVRPISSQESEILAAVNATAAVPANLAGVSIPRDKLRELIDRAVDQELELKRSAGENAAPEVRQRIEGNQCRDPLAINAERYFAMGREVGLSDEALTQTLERFRRQTEIKDKIIERREHFQDRMAQKRRDLALPPDASLELVNHEADVKAAVDAFLGKIDGSINHAIDRNQETIDTNIQFDWSMYKFDRKTFTARSLLRIATAPIYLFDVKILESAKAMFMDRDFTSVSSSPSLKRLFAETEGLGLEPIFARRYDKVSISFRLPDASCKR